MDKTNKIADMNKEQIAQYFNPELFGHKKQEFTDSFIGEYLMHCSEGQILELARQLNNFINKV